MEPTAGLQISQPKWWCARRAVLFDQLAEGLDALHAHDVVKLLAGVLKVLANRLVHLNAACGQLMIHHAFQKRRAAAAAGAGAGVTFHGCQVAGACVNGRANAGLGDVMARAGCIAVSGSASGPSAGAAPLCGKINEAGSLGSSIPLA